MITGVLLLTIAGIAEKILGVILKIPLTGYLGSDGMGYFNSAYNIFSTFYTISITGLPIATSILISRSRAKGKKREVNNLFRVSLSLFVLVGLIGTSIMFFGAKTIANLIDKNNNSYYCIQTIAPILLIICISSAIRGYYQGHQNMMPSAVSELLDAVGKCALGIIFGGFAVSRGYSVEVAAAAAIGGITIGHLLGMGFLIVTKSLVKPNYSYLSVEIDDTTSERYRTLAKKMLRIAVPITLGSLALGLTSTIDTFTIMNMLDSDNAMALYGDYTTLAVTLYRLPHAFIVPISSSLTPALTAAIASSNIKRTKITLHSALKVTSVISIPCSIGMGVLASPIITLLFGRSATKESIARTAPLLSLLAVAIFLMAILTVTSSMLQSYGKQSKPVVSMTCGTVVKLVLNIILIPSFGIIGAPIATVSGYFVMALINFIYILKYTDVSAKVIWAFIPPLLATAVCLPFTVLAYILTLKIATNAIATFVSIIITIAVYALALFITRTFTKDDILMLPKGEKIYRALAKAKLMK